jgi:hypothetical protein
VAAKKVATFKPGKEFAASLNQEAGNQETGNQEAGNQEAERAAQ